MTITIRQRQIPPGLLGRVNSVYRMIAWAGIPVGALAGGVVADRWGLRMPFIVEGAAMTALTVVLAAQLPGTTA